MTDEQEKEMARFDSVLVRMAFDEFEAAIVARAMQSVRWVDVFSIVVTHSENEAFNGTKKRFHVFCKYASYYVGPDDIDEAIHKARATWETQ